MLYCLGLFEAEDYWGGGILAVLETSKAAPQNASEPMSCQRSFEYWMFSWIALLFTGPKRGLILYVLDVQLQAFYENLQGDSLDSRFVLFHAVKQECLLLWGTFWCGRITWQSFFLMWADKQNVWQQTIRTPWKAINLPLLSSCALEKALEL